MKRLAFAAALAVTLAAGCSQTTGANTAKLIGSQDVVLVDQLETIDGGLFFARRDVLSDGGILNVGVPNQFLFVTSVDTNELRVMQLYRPTALGRQFVPAPNPVETLSIPVLSRPSMLAVDEGLHASGRRVTGSYVYAARPGSSLISIVGADPSELRVVTPNPIPTPGPVTAMAAWLGAGLTTFPEKTTLYVATFDGRRGGVFRIELPAHPNALRRAIANATPTNPAVRAETLFDVDAEAVMALQVMPPLAGRTVDGQPFCDTGECLAIATRRGAGADGRNLLIDPRTLRAVPLDFGGPVRDYATTGTGIRLFGVLDEEKCGGPSCGGVLAVDTLTATGADGFPRTRDFSGEVMLPISTGDSLPMGLSLAQGVQIRQTIETYDGGVRELGLAIQEYALLGVVSSSNGQFQFFDGLAATPIDYDARRTSVASATLQVPGVGEDGGLSYVLPDGGFNGYRAKGTLTEVFPEGGTGNEPWRVYDVGNPDGGTSADGGGLFRVDVSDGYLNSQNLVVIYEGQLPGLVGVATTAADGTTLTVPGGYESRAAVGDRVIFIVDPHADGGLLEDGGVPPAFECGSAAIAAIGAGTIEVDQVPAGCDDRVRFNVRVSGAQPYVVAADREGYLGRAAVGETVTYTRRYLVKPLGWQSVRPALRVTVGDTIPLVTGAYWAFELTGGLQAYTTTFDPTNCSAPQLPGRVILAQLPTLTESQGLTYPWELTGVLPSGNSVFYLSLATTAAGQVGLNDGLSCYR